MISRASFGISPIDDDPAIGQRIFRLFGDRRCRVCRVGRSGFRVGLLSVAVAPLILCFFSRLARRDIDVEPIEAKVIDVFSKEAHDAGLDMERLDGDERRKLIHAAAADSQIGAVDAKGRKGAQVQVAEFHVTVELRR